MASLKINIGTKPFVPTVRTPVRAQIQRRVRQRDRDEIERLYMTGMSIRAVAAQVGVSKTTVLTTLKARGVEMRPRGMHY